MDFYKVKNVRKEDVEKFEYDNKRVGVIVHIEDKNGKILLQQRGKKSRDDNFLYEDVGGSIEKEDFNYRDAIIREMKEEMGDNININLLDSIGIYHCLKGNINWVFVVFEGEYIDGEPKIMEPEKCNGYKFWSYDEAVSSDTVSLTCRKLIKEVAESRS